MCNTCILIDIHLQVKKMLIFTADRFAIKATRFTCQYSLKDLVYPGRLLRLAGAAVGRIFGARAICITAAARGKCRFYIREM